MLKVSHVERHIMRAEANMWESLATSIQCEAPDLGPWKIITELGEGDGEWGDLSETVRNRRVAIRLDNWEGKATAEEGTPRGRRGSPGGEPLRCWEEGRDCGRHSCLFFLLQGE